MVKLLRLEHRSAAAFLVFSIDGVHVGTVEVAPLESPQFLARICIHTVALTITGSIVITGTVAIRLPAVDEDHIAGLQIILLSFIDQLSFPIFDHKAKVRLQFFTLAGVRFNRCQRSDLLKMKQRGAGKGGQGV